MSVGLLDVLNKKEVEAIILHELAHIKNRSSILKVSNLIFKFSPLSIIAKFNGDTNSEEKRTDEFAIKMQKTRRYIDSSKRKLDRFELF